MNDKHIYEATDNGINNQSQYGRWITVIDKEIESRLDEIRKDIQALDSLKAAILKLIPNLNTYYSNLKICYSYTTSAISMTGVSNKIEDINTKATNMNTYSNELSSITNKIESKISDLEKERKQIEPNLEIRKWVNY